MKILITSDIHKDLKRLNKVLTKHQKLDYHLDAGDSNLSIDYLNEKKITSVKGNTDFFSKLPVHRILEIDNKRILLIHGHTLKVKTTKDILYNYAKGLNVDVCIYGHTHIQLMENNKGIIFLNPGSITNNNYVLYEEGKFNLF